MGIFRIAGNFIFPNKCIFCEKDFPVWSSRIYCRECYYKISLIDEYRCVLCGRETGPGVKLCKSCASHKMYFDGGFPCFNYSGVVKELIHKFKFRNKYYLAKPIAGFMADKLKKSKMTRFDYIVYPPVNKKTFEKRGYNQTYHIARFLKRSINGKLLKNAVIKCRETEKQSLMSYDKRFKNVKGAFKLSRGCERKIKGKIILLVDDVLTSGATACEIARILKQGGAAAVYVSTLAATK